MVSARACLAPVLSAAAIAGPGAAGCGQRRAPEAPAAATVPGVADLMLVGGRVHTPAGSVSAVGIRGSRIAVTGDDEAVERWVGPKTRTIRLDGKTVVPGLSDAHMHLMGLGRTRFELDLVGSASVDEIRAKLAQAVAKAAPGAWIRGRGWDQNDWPGAAGRFPTRVDLDPIAPEHPVVLTRIDGHAIWVNSRALAVAGITASTKAPKGGEIVIDGGEPTGILVDNAMPLVRRHVPEASIEELSQYARLAQQECLAAGLTQVQDMGVGPTELGVLRALDAKGALKLRVYAMLDGSSGDLPSLLAEGPKVPDPFGAGRLTVRGVKFFIDGALGSRGAALLAPYTDQPDSRGLLVTEPAALEAMVRSARKHGFQVATHAIGDRGNRVILDIYERVFGAEATQARPRVEHAQVVSPEDLPRFSRLGVIASMQPTHATSDMPWAEQRVGPERIQGAYAWQSLLQISTAIAAGSDAPVESVQPIAGLYAAITRADSAGNPDGGWYVDQAMTPQQALAAFTSGAAFASFREEVAGTIEPGKVADLTVLDADPTEAEASELLKIRAAYTIVGGTVAYER